MADQAVCGVAGNYSEALVATFRSGRTLLALSDLVPMVPCQRAATETMVAVCDNGHRREGLVCPAHLDVLTRPNREAGDVALCLPCDAAGRGDVPLTPLIPVPDRPYESPVDRCSICHRPAIIGCECSEATRG